MGCAGSIILFIFLLFGGGDMFDAAIRIFFVSVWFSLVILIWSFYPVWIDYLLVYLGKVEAMKELGTVGDSFGALNTLFSGLAFAGIIVSITLQSKELRNTRREMAEQKDQFVIQNASLGRQVFESTFFQLLHLHNEIVDAISANNRIVAGAQIVFGRAAIGVFFEEFVLRHHRVYFPDEPDPKNVSEEYEMFHRLRHEQVGHYFRNIYQILKFVDCSSVGDKRFYTNLLRAQLSSNELSLLFYNCLSSIGDKKFKPLLERYAFLEHMPINGCMTDEEVLSYRSTVFGDSPAWLASIAERRSLAQP